MRISGLDPDAHGRRPWNAGNMVGAKRPLKPRDVWAIRFFLDEHRRLRDRALFDLAIDSKLRSCDIVKMKIGDIVAGGAIRNRATVMQQKTKRPVQFEIMTEARQTLLTWLNRRGGSHDHFIFPSRVNYMGHLSTRQYARLVDEWVGAVGLNVHEYGTHSMRLTKASLIYKATANCGLSRYCCAIRTLRIPSAIWVLISTMGLLRQNGQKFDREGSSQQRGAVLGSTERKAAFNDGHFAAERRLSCREQPPLSSPRPPSRGPAFLLRQGQEAGPRVTPGETRI
jgi:Phage integrase family